MTTQDKDLDIQAIHEAVEDYYGGWYKADVECMNRCLHPGLAKRAIKLDENGKEYLRHLTKEVMVNATREGGGSDVPAEKKTWSITILDSYKEIATVKVVAGEYMEYIHLARQDGQWQVLNVLWTDRR
jgi:hypothetical protein